jgi:hypothetical protein
MAQQNTGTTETTSGTTETRVNYDLTPRHYGCIESIWESEYDEEMGMSTHSVSFYNGETITFSLKSKHIKEMSLFLAKNEAEQRYINHLMKES